MKNSGFEYDANGNMTRRWDPIASQWQRLVWDHENRLQAIKNDAQTQTIESYLYDANGQRVKKVSGSTTTYYPYPHYEVAVTGSTTTITKYYFFAGMRVAMKVGTTLTYLHADHLGTTDYATNTSGGMVSGQGYYAYGRTRFGSVPTDHQFTGQKLDAASGLYYYGARYYDPQIGLFISPDTLVPDPANIWDYNRFAYARLNPMKFNDPTGHCATLKDGSPNWEGQVNYQCWQTAYAIYGYGAAGLAAFQQDWKVTADDWLENIAKQEFATTEYLQPFLNKYNSQFCAQAGLSCGQYVPNPPPAQSAHSSIDGFALGVGFGGSYAIISLGGGMEVVVSLETGEIALVTYYSGGGGVGAGANAKAYAAILINMSRPEDYAGPTNGVEGTVSTPLFGIVGGRFWSATPNGTSGWYLGYAPGARLSASSSRTSYTLPWIKYDLSANQISFPQVTQIIQQIFGDSDK